MTVELHGLKFCLSLALIATLHFPTIYEDIEGKEASWSEDVKPKTCSNYYAKFSIVLNGVDTFVASWSCTQTLKDKYGKDQKIFSVTWQVTFLIFQWPRPLIDNSGVLYLYANYSSRKDQHKQILFNSRWVQTFENHILGIPKFFCWLPIFQVFFLGLLHLLWYLAKKRGVI